MRRAYLARFRFHYHCSFAVVLLGLLTVKRDVTAQMLASVQALYIAFNVLLYGGIYTINAVADAPFDRLHQRKRLRPVASGTISRRSAGVFGTMLIAAGLASGYTLFAPAISRLFAAVLAVNLFSNFFARRIPYLDIGHQCCHLSVLLSLGRCACGRHGLASSAIAGIPGLVFQRCVVLLPGW